MYVHVGQMHVSMFTARAYATGYIQFGHSPLPLVNETLLVFECLSLVNLHLCGRRV